MAYVPRTSYEPDVRPSLPLQGEGAGMFNGYPELWGRHLCLDLVNSLERDPRGSGQTIDWLPKAGWRAAFLAHWQLTLEVRSEPIPFAALIELRTFLRSLLERWARREKPEARSVQTLQTMLSLAPITRDLRAGPDGFTVEVRPFVRNWNWVLAQAAASAIDLVGQGDPHLLKGCSNPDCTWLFYDDTLNHSRRWCSPRACGNLMKVRRFRAQRH